MNSCHKAAWDKFEEMRADRDDYIFQVMVLRRRVRELQEELLCLARANN